MKANDNQIPIIYYIPIKNGEHLIRRMEDGEEIKYIECPYTEEKSLFATVCLMLFVVFMVASLISGLMSGTGIKSCQRAGIASKETCQRLVER